MADGAMETTPKPATPPAAAASAALVKPELQGQGDAEVTSCGILEEPQTPRPVRRKIRIRGERICAVCGDRANSHNFGALTCDTCKAFFRRNAYKRKKIPDCVFANNCVVDKTTRRFCSACRLKKCFAVGMTPELILSNKEENDSRTEKASSPRMSPPKVHDPKMAAEQLVPSDRPQRTVHAGKDTSLLEDLCAQTLGIARPAAASSSRPTPEPQGTQASLEAPQEQSLNDAILELLAAGSDISTLASLYGLESSSSSETGSSSLWATPLNPRHPVPADRGPSRDKLRSRGQEFKHVAREELPWDMQMYWPLTGEERALLTQLTSIFQKTLTDTFDGPAPCAQQLPDVGCLTTETMTNILELSMYKNVFFAKAVPEFRNLRQSDQISVLKSSAMQMYSVRCASCYLPEEKVWVGTHGQVSATDVMKVFDYEVGVHHFIDYCTSLKYVVKINSTLYALMLCILLFDPRGPALEDRILVNSFRDRYLLLLKHYLESEYSFSFADLYLAEIMDSLNDVRVLGEKLHTFYRQYSNYFLPLVAECMSL